PARTSSLWSAAACRRFGVGGLCPPIAPPGCRSSHQRAGLGSFPVAPASRRRFAPVVAGNRRRDAGATAKVDVRGELVGKAIRSQPVPLPARRKLILSAPLLSPGTAQFC